MAHRIGHKDGIFAEKSMDLEAILAQSAEKASSKNSHREQKFSPYDIFDPIGNFMKALQIPEALEEGNVPSSMFTQKLIHRYSYFSYDFINCTDYEKQ